MPTQTITLTATGNDGYQDTDTTFTTTPAAGAIYVFGPSPTENLGASFPIATAIPAGSTINDCRFRVSNNSADDLGASVVNPQMQNIDPTTAAVWSNSNLPSSATAVSAHNTASITWAEGFYFGSADSDPIQFASDLQTVLDAGGGAAVGERINIFIEWVSGTGFPSFRDIDAAGTDDMQLFIDWTEPAANVLGIKRTPGPHLRGPANRKHRFRGSPRAYTIGGQLFLQELVGTLSFVGAITKQAQKSLIGTLSFIGDLTTIRLFVKALDGTLAFAGTLTKQTQKTLVGGLPLAGAITKQTQKALSGVLSFAGTLTKQMQRALIATLSMAGEFVTLYIPFIPGGVVRGKIRRFFSMISGRR